MTVKNLLLPLTFVFCSYIQAQQNFFNVPSSEITEKNKVFFQQQFNFFSKISASNTTFSYGIGHHTEIGLNVLGITYDYKHAEFLKSALNEQPVFPSFGFNAQTKIMETSKDELAIGAQLLFPNKISDAEYYTYINNKLLYKNYKIVTGVYFGNNNYFDDKSRFSSQFNKVGVQLGIEYQLIKDKLFFQSDFISGKTAMSNLIIGGAYRCSKHAIISSGYQFPNDKNHYSKGVILEFTFI